MSQTRLHYLASTFMIVKNNLQGDIFDVPMARTGFFLPRIDNLISCCCCCFERVLLSILAFFSSSTFILVVKVCFPTQLYLDIYICQDKLGTYISQF